MSEIKVTKENVLRAWKIAKDEIGSHNAQIFKVLFPEAFEEQREEKQEKKEWTELDEILLRFSEDEIDIEKAKRQITDLVEITVDKCIPYCFECNGKYRKLILLSEIKQSFDEM